MKKITLFLFVLCAVSFGFAQETFTATPNLDLTPFDNDPAGTTTNQVVSTATITNITDIDVDLDVSHTWVGDLIFTLESPAGTVVTLIDRPGRETTGAGCSGDNIDANLNDEGLDGAAEDSCVPANDPALTGDLTIDGDAAGLLTDTLDMFDGEDPNGTWILFVSDNAGGDFGQLNEWQLIITGNTLGLEDESAQTFSFSPNPVKDKLRLNAVRNISNVEIYNIIGQQVLRSAPNALTSEVDMSDLNAGAYFVRVSVGDVTQTVKVIKE